MISCTLWHSKSTTSSINHISYHLNICNKCSKALTCSIYTQYVLISVIFTLYVLILSNIPLLIVDFWEVTEREDLKLISINFSPCWKKIYQRKEDSWGLSWSYVAITWNRGGMVIENTLSDWVDSVRGVKHSIFQVTLKFPKKLAGIHIKYL